MLGLSGTVSVVQQNLGVPPSGEWDATTMGAIGPFQASGGRPLRMYATGQPDPATLINAGYYDPLEYMPRGWREYVQGGSAPGTFWRDLGVANSQIPQWAWLTLGVMFMGFGYYIHRKRKRRARAK
jgi:hypothetical protein